MTRKSDQWQHLLFCFIQPPFQVIKSTILTITVKDHNNRLDTLMKDSQECHRCERYYWSNEGRDGCVPMPEEFLASTDPIAIVQLSFSVIGLLLVIVILLLILKHKELSALKAAGFGVYAVLLMALAGCFCSSLLFVGRP